MTLIAHYPLQEDSGGTAFDVRGSNDGTVNGATVGQTGILSTTAFSFDGADDWIGVPDDSSLSFADSNSFSTSFWVKSASTAQDEPIVSKWGGTNEYIVKFNGNSGSDIGLFVGGSTELVQVSTDWNDGNWNHYTTTWDETGDSVIYKNGSEIARATATATALDGTDDVEIARRTPEGNYTNAELADLRIYDHALTAQEVQYLYGVVAGNSRLQTKFKAV